MILYYKPTCPFCMKVLAFAQENNIELELRDIIADDRYADEVVELGGKQQVPFLVDKPNGMLLYESDDIIAYLQHTAS